MKNLLYKEFKLATHPTCYIFMLFGLMLLIPSYPYYVAFFYTCLGTFFVFMIGRENKDTFFTVLLPIAKRDAVKARILLVASFQLGTVLLSVPWAFIGVMINPNPETGNAAGIESNVAFYGLVLIMFSVFNAIYIPKFYKTAYKAGAPFIVASVAMGLFIGVAEALVAIPSPIKDYLDTTEVSKQLLQLPVLFAGILIWLVTLVLVFKKSAKNFEKVDL